MSLEIDKISDYKTMKSLKTRGKIILILGKSYQSNANKLVSKIEAPQEFEGVGHVRPEF
jgi:hypothetical protein